MTKTDLEKFRNTLETKRSELSGSLRNRDEIVIEKAPDALDEVQLAGERELAIRNLDRDSNMLRQIRRALGRIADGSYGVCLHCDEDISPKRVAAVPWAAYCIKCQEQVDRNEIEVDDHADVFDDGCDVLVVLAVRELVEADVLQVLQAIGRAEKISSCRFG